MFETILGIFGSAAGGGLLGLIGTAFKGWQEIKDRQNERLHLERMREQDLAEIQLEHDLAIKQTETEFEGMATLKNIEREISHDISAAKNLSDSYKHDKATYSQIALKKLSGFYAGFAGFFLVLVDVLRGVMRPGITAYLLIIESYIAWYLYQLVLSLNLITGDNAMELLTQVVLSIVFLTSTSITWWFGSRPNQQRK